jgi:hypothetical protein
MEPAGHAAYYRIEFLEEAPQGRTSLWEFTDPVPAKAVCDPPVVATKDVGAILEGPGSPGADTLEVLAAESGSQDEARGRDEFRAWVGAPSITAKVEDVFVLWRPGRAAVRAPADRIESALLALAEFAFYEAHLRKIEAETAVRWPEAQDDTHLAYDVAAADLARHKELGERTVGVFHRRIRQARIGSHLSRPADTLPPLARQLGNVLREKAEVEDRLESLDEKTEVYEYIYELASQRMGEYRNARREMILEILIILILVIETIATVVDGLIYWYVSPD